MHLTTFKLYNLAEFDFNSALFQISQQSFIVNPTSVTVLNAPTELTEPFWVTSRFVTNSDKAIQTVVCSNGDGVYNRSFDWSEQAYTEWYGAGGGGSSKVSIESSDDSLNVLNDDNSYDLTIKFDANGVPVNIFNPSDNYQELTADATIDITKLRIGALFMIKAVKYVTVSFSNGTLSGFSALGTSTSQPINEGEVLVICRVTNDLVARIA